MFVLDLAKPPFRHKKVVTFITRIQYVVESKTSASHIKGEVSVPLPRPCKPKEDGYSDIVSVDVSWLLTDSPHVLMSRKAMHGCPL